MKNVKVWRVKVVKPRRQLPVVGQCTCIVAMDLLHRRYKIAVISTTSTSHSTVERVGYTFCFPPDPLVSESLSSASQARPSRPLATTSAIGLMLYLILVCPRMLSTK